MKNLTTKQLMKALLASLHCEDSVARISLGIHSERDLILAELDRRFLDGWHQRQFEKVNEDWNKRLEAYRVKTDAPIKSTDIVREITK